MPTDLVPPTDGPGREKGDRRNIFGMSKEPRRVEHQKTDKGYVPVYTTAVVEQPADYPAADHDTWGRLYQRQRELLRRSQIRMAADEQQTQHNVAVVRAVEPLGDFTLGVAEVGDHIVVR